MAPSPGVSGTCDESDWPDKDHEIVCGECKVLVDHFDSKYQTCDGYCASIGRTCVGAWEEMNDDCQVKYDMTCGQALDSSDAICQCSHFSGIAAGGIICEDGSDMITDFSAGKRTDKGHPFYQILTGPFLLAPTSNFLNHLKVPFPSFAGKGWTLSFWYRHVPCDHTVCEINLFTVRYASAWSGEHEFKVRLSNDKILIDIWARPCPTGSCRTVESEGLVLSFGDLGNSDRFNFDDKVWRFVAVQLDERSHQLKFFLDGSLAKANPLPIEDSNNAVYKWFPVGEEGWTIWFAISGTSLHDMRAYLPEEGRDRLEEEEISSLAGATTSQLDSRFKCLPPSSSELLDTDWRDWGGRDCQWYLNARKMNPLVCDAAGAATNCPNSCASKKICFTGTQTCDSTYFVFDRTQLMVPKHANGSLCLGSTFQRQELVQQCRDWLASGELGSLGGRGGRDDPVAKDSKNWKTEHNRAISQWLDTVWFWSKELATVEGKHLNITDCEQLEAAIDDHCVFDMKPVKNKNLKI